MRLRPSTKRKPPVILSNTLVGDAVKGLYREPETGNPKNIVGI